jgi:hypothetical protein
LWFGGILTVGLALTCETQVVLSFVTGLVMELGLLMSQDYIVSKFLSSSGQENSGNALALIGVRYGLTILLLYALTQNDLLSPLAFVGGFLLTHAVMVGKVAEKLVLKRLRAKGL